MTCKWPMTPPAPEAGEPSPWWSHARGNQVDEALRHFAADARVVVEGVVPELTRADLQTSYDFQIVHDFLLSESTVLGAVPDGPVRGQTVFGT
jgi:hypothetical protein